MSFVSTEIDVIASEEKRKKGLEVSSHIVKDLKGKSDWQLRKTRMPSHTCMQRNREKDVAFVADENGRFELAHAFHLRVSLRSQFLVASSFDNLCHRNFRASSGTGVVFHGVYNAAKSSRKSDASKTIHVVM
ncbi:hypothetical protein Fmac_030454 [Flemingia macrophylla]|uniref:Uncharacterized protein n=1 Tax=Flemingia macrophylla TaxID=520843 RepID=A0ABD1KZR0_9FABA